MVGTHAMQPEQHTQEDVPLMRVFAWHTRCFASVLVQSKLKQAQQQQLVDSVTGQPLFKPQINRTSASYPRCKADLPVGEYLYRRRLDRKEHLQELERREGDRVRSERDKGCVNKQSERILSRLKQRRFTQVFQFLDAQGTGELNLLEVVLGGSLQFSNLSAEARKDVEGAALLKCAVEGLCTVPPSPAILQDMQVWLQRPAIDECCCVVLLERGVNT
jgi:hypothetical protein